MSIPRLLLVPTHRTGLANAVAAALAEIVTAQGRKVRYHHLGPLSPVVVLGSLGGHGLPRPALYDEDEPPPALRRGHPVGANLSLLSASHGVLDRREDVRWTPGRRRPPARLPGGARCSTAAGGAPGIQALVARSQDPSLASCQPGRSAPLRRRRPRSLRRCCRQALARRGYARWSAACSRGTGPAGTRRRPGAWGLPLDQALLEAVERQVDVGALVDLAGQRGFPRLAEPADRPGRRWPAGHGRRRHGLHSLEPRLDRGAARRRSADPASRPGRGRGRCPTRRRAWSSPAPSGRRACRTSP